MPKMNPVDYILNALNIKMMSLKESDNEHMLITKYIMNTIESREYEIKSIFAIERRGKRKREKKREMWKRGGRANSPMEESSKQDAAMARVKGGELFGDFIPRPPNCSSRI